MVIFFQRALKEYYDYSPILLAKKALNIFEKLL
jgi:hypothetical protein